MGNILVTGADGFVGNALFESFVEGGRVIGLTRSSHASHEDKRKIPGCVTDLGLLRSLTSRYEIDTIVHLAASTVLRQAYVDPLSCIHTNITGTANILEVARTNPDVKTIVVATSDKAYGDSEITPYIESLPMQASDVYGTTKACCDLLAQSYHLTYGMDVRIVRSGNVFGPGDRNYSRLVPNSMRKLWRGESPVVYAGAENHSREFVYIDDEVNAYQTIIEHGKPGESYNIGSKDRFSVIGLVERMCEVFNKRLSPYAGSFKPVIEPRDFVEIKDQSLDTGKLEKLGWSPINLSFDDKLIETFKYYATSNP